MRRMIYLVAILAAGCQGLTITGESTARLRLRIAGEDPMSKGVVKPIPDTNKMFLFIKGEAGDTVYNGLYGERPAELKVEAGNYTVNIYSHLPTLPEFDAPCWSDSKTITLAAGSVTSLAMVCRQSNGAMRLGFSPEFRQKYSAYTPEITDALGTVQYQFSEERFLYLKPGNIYVRLTPLATGQQVPLFSKLLAAKEMITINLRLLQGDSASFGGGILIDSTSNWQTDSVFIGGNDGSTQEKALTLERIREYVGLKIWLTGYIIGGDVSDDTLRFTAPFTKETYLAVAATTTERSRDKCYAVSLPLGAIRDSCSLVRFPANIGRKICIKGTVKESYYGSPGVDPVTEIIME